MTRERVGVRSVIALGPAGEVVVRGPVLGAGGSLLRRAALDAVEAASSARPEVVIDLRRCTGLDEAALVALLCADHQAVRTGRRVVLRGPSRGVHATMQALAASLLPLVVEPQPERAPGDRGRLSVVGGTESDSAPPSRGDAPVACAEASPEDRVSHRRALLARLRDPLRRPARPPEWIETA